MSVIYIIHIILVYFIILGFLLPYEYLWIHLLTFPLIVLHWKTNNDKCILTEYEYTSEQIDNKKAPFMQKFFASYGLNLNDKDADKATYILFTTTWLISCIRYYRFIC